MKTVLVLILTFIAQLANSQTLTSITGTKCSLVPPIGFEVAKNFSGFQEVTSGASIMITEMPGPYLTIANGFTAEALASRGMKLLNKQTIFFQSDSATYIELSQPANGTVYFKQMLIFGDASNTVLVNGIYPESSKTIAANIKESILSTVYDANKKEDPLEAASFSIDTKGTAFKAVKYASGSLIFSIDGKIPTSKPTFIVGNSIAKVATTDRKKYTEERLKKLPRGEFIDIKQMNEIRIQQMDGYEIVAEGMNKEGFPTLLYLVMVFNNTGDYYIMLGESTEDFEKYTSLFKVMAKSLQVK